MQGDGNLETVGAAQFPQRLVARPNLTVLVS